jgi:hypothetical protein
MAVVSFIVYPLPLSEKINETFVMYHVMSNSRHVQFSFVKGALDPAKTCAENSNFQLKIQINLKFQNTVVTYR